MQPDHAKLSTITALVLLVLSSAGAAATNAPTDGGCLFFGASTDGGDPLDAEDGDGTRNGSDENCAPDAEGPGTGSGDVWAARALPAALEDLLVTAARTHNAHDPFLTVRPCPAAPDDLRVRGDLSDAPVPGAGTASARARFTVSVAEPTGAWSCSTVRPARLRTLSADRRALEDCAFRGDATASVATPGGGAGAHADDRGRYCLLFGAGISIPRDGDGVPPATTGIRVDDGPSRVPVDGSTTPPTGDADPDVLTVTGRSKGRAPLPLDGPGSAVLALTLAGIGSLLTALHLYRRLRGDELMDNPVRSELVHTVRREPAIHASELARKLGVDVTTVLYHARLLEEAGEIVLKRSEREIAFYDNNGHRPLERELQFALRKRSKRAVLDLLRSEPGLTLTEAADRLDKAPSTIKHHVDELLERGLLVEDADGRGRSIDLTSAARATIAELT